MSSEWAGRRLCAGSASLPQPCKMSAMTIANTIPFTARRASKLTHPEILISLKSMTLKRIRLSFLRIYSTSFLARARS